MLLNFSVMDKPDLADFIDDLKNDKLKDLQHVIIVYIRAYL